MGEWQRVLWLLDDYDLESLSPLLLEDLLLSVIVRHLDLSDTAKPLQLAESCESNHLALLARQRN